MIHKSSSATAAKALRDAAAQALPVAAAEVPSETGCAVEWIETIDDLLALEEDWLRLEQSGSRAHSVFQSFAWCSTWARAYTDSDTGLALKTAVVRRNGAVALIWPLMKVRRGPFTLLTWLSFPAAQYGDVLVDDGEDPTQLMEQAWAQILRQTDADGIALHYVREDANAYSFLQRICPALPDAHQAPQLDLTAFESAEDYTAALSRNQRAQRTRLRKKLETAGKLEFHMHRGNSAYEAAVREAIDLKKAWLVRQGLKTGMIGDPRIVDVLIALGRQPDPVVTASVLSLDGEPLTIDLSYRYNGRYMGCVIAENTDAGSTSPAKVHFDLLQKKCIEQGYSVFDMMIPATPFKQHWTNSAVAAKDFIQPLNFWGYLYCGLYLRHARPALKNLYYAVGPKLRAPFIRLLSAMRLVR